MQLILHKFTSSQQTLIFFVYSLQTLDVLFRIKPQE